MARFVFLHGAGFGPWSWDLVRPLLEAEGHDVVAVDLRLESAGIATNTSMAAEAVGSAGSDTIVVGHALGCTLVPLVAKRVEATGMVWVCGMIPVAGQSISQQIAGDPTIVPFFTDPSEPSARSGPAPDDQQPTTHDDGGMEEWSAAQLRLDTAEEAPTGPPSPEVFAELVFPDCDPETKAWAIDMIRRQPQDASVPGVVGVANEPFPDTPWPTATAAFILARSDRALSAAWSRTAARDRLGVTAIELDGDHAPNLSRPGELAGLLLSFAQSL